MVKNGNLAKWVNLKKKNLKICYIVPPVDNIITIQVNFKFRFFCFLKDFCPMPNAKFNIIIFKFLGAHVRISAVIRAGWQCQKCKWCQICRQTNQDDRYLLCDVCDGAFHAHCLRPQMASIPKNGWKCKVKFQLIFRENTSQHNFSCQYNKKKLVFFIFPI